MMDEKKNNGQILNISNSRDVSVSNISNYVKNESAAGDSASSSAREILLQKWEALEPKSDLTEILNLMIQESKKDSENACKQMILMKSRWFALKSDIEKGLISQEEYEQGYVFLRKSLFEEINRLQP